MIGNKKIRVGDCWFDAEAIKSTYKTVEAFVAKYSAYVRPDELRAFYNSITEAAKPSKKDKGGE